MLPEYLQHWGVERAPFALTPDPDMLYMSSQHRECLLRLKYAVVSGKGGALLVSENAGDGKTSVLRRLCADLDREFDGRCRTCFISHPTLEPIEMIQEISRQLGGATPEGTKTDALSALGERLEHLYHAGDKVVVIVDEGQMLAHRPDMLQELRILLNFCVADAFLLTFIFSGQAPLEPAVRGMPEFWQRLPVRYFLRNLDPQDTADMVHHRLEVVGVENDIFDQDACKLLHRYSEGCPRVICSIADLCLVIGHSQRLREIGPDIVQLAAVDMGLTEGERGGGFHYYHFVRGELQTDQDGGKKADGGRPERGRRRIKLDAGEAGASTGTSATPAAASAAQGVAPGRSMASAPRPAAFVSKLPGAPKPAPPLSGLPQSVPPEPPEPDGFITCPNCRTQSSPDLEACSVCSRALGVVCGFCGSQHRADAHRCRACGEPASPVEDQLTHDLGQAIAAAGLKGGLPRPALQSGARYRLDRLPGEEVLHLVQPRLQLEIVLEGRVRQSAGPGPCTLAITNRSLAMLLPRSFIRLNYTRVQVSSFPLPDSPRDCGLRLEHGETAYLLHRPGHDLTPLVGPLEAWVSGKLATLVVPVPTLASAQG